MSKECVGDLRNDCFLVIYIIKVSGLFLRIYKFLQFVLYRQIAKCWN